jgi:hypothetical protein
LLHWLSPLACGMKIRNPNIEIRNKLKSEVQIPKSVMELF